MRLTILQNTPGCADGHYQVKAGGCIAASLHWADESGALPGWSPLAYLPIKPNGVGIYQMEGGRAIPEEATHVLARAVSADFTTVEETVTPIPKPAGKTVKQAGQRFLILTDLHLSNKPWKVRKALSMGREYDAVLITGDMTNDAAPEQLERFWTCVTEALPDTPVFAVAGNHDYPARPIPQIRNGICEYPILQEKLLERAGEMGCAFTQDASSAYAVQMGDTEILGLNAVTHGRIFKFSETGQLEWLFWHLQESKAKRHIILCHAPLAAHRPYKQPGDQPYLGKDRELQRILDVQRSCILFVSGHTHVSLNCREGCVERDVQYKRNQQDKRDNIYINAGSIRPTALKSDEFLQPECWTEGNVVELLLEQECITVTGISVKTGQRIARGHYRFPTGKEEENGRIQEE